MTGRYFDELPRGEVIPHAMTRTITETDNVLFSAITMNPQPMHLDEEFAQQSQYGTRIVNGILTLGILLGVSVPELTLGTTIAVMALESVVFPNPVFHGDTLHAETEVIERRESRSRPNAGIVIFEHRAYNQKNELIAKCRRVALMRKRPNESVSSVSTA
ncbi:MAG: MaoC family dehydratase [Alphaproteobacteria bacterium]|nr:MaoC family dehydratase [Alphaproteobacteria bacterium]